MRAMERRGGWGEESREEEGRGGKGKGRDRGWWVVDRNRDTVL